MNWLNVQATAFLSERSSGASTKLRDLDVLARVTLVIDKFEYQ